MRKNVSLKKPIQERAKVVMKERGFGGLSDMIATLVREEYERYYPPSLKDAPGPAPRPVSKPGPVDYKIKKAKAKASSKKFSAAEQGALDIITEKDSPSSSSQ